MIFKLFYKIEIGKNSVGIEVKISLKFLETLILFLNPRFNLIIILSIVFRKDLAR